MNPGYQRCQSQLVTIALHRLTCVWHVGKVKIPLSGTQNIQAYSKNKFLNHCFHTGFLHCAIFLLLRRISDSSFSCRLISSLSCSFRGSSLSQKFHLLEKSTTHDAETDILSFAQFGRIIAFAQISPFGKIDYARHFCFLCQIFVIFPKVKIVS